MEEYDEIKEETALLIMIEAISSEIERLEQSEDTQNKEYRAFVTKMEVVKDMLVNM